LELRTSNHGLIDEFRIQNSQFRILRILLIATVAFAALDAQRVALGGIYAYQHALSPLATHAGIRCRFTPSCSRYADVVIRRDGVLRGGWQTLKRVARCNPATPFGTRDDP
jgi:putative membrane protein insertion efficiency factor